MRIVHICWSGALGGLENEAWSIAVEQARRHEVSMFYLSTSSPRCAPRGSLLCVSEGQMRSGLDLWRFLCMMARLFRSRPDIIHNHEANPLALLSGWICPRARLINHIHTIAADDVATWCERMVRKLVGMRIAAWVANSASTKQRLFAQRGVPADRIEVIPNGIDVGVFSDVRSHRENVRRSLGIPHGAKVVGTVGHLTWRKGPDLFLCVAARIRESVPEAVFVVVGGGEMGCELRRMQGDLGLPDDQVRWLGERDDIPGVLACMDVFLSTSRVETFGIAIIEAMAAGIPVAAFGIDGIPEVTAGCAWLAAREDVRDLAAQCVRLLCGEELVAERVTRALNIVQERYALDRVVEQVGGLYAELLKRG